MYRLDPSRKDLAAEFRRQPIGHHSEELRQVLNLFRAEPMEGKYCLIVTKPYKEWTLARLSGRRGVGPVLMHNHVFTSIEDAEWHVFKLRWAKYTGKELDDADLD
jgi:hypothetical protein